MQLRLGFQRRGSGSAYFLLREFGEIPGKTYMSDQINIGVCVHESDGADCAARLLDFEEKTNTV